MPAYFAEGVIRGRLRIDPSRLRTLAGIDLERHHPVMVTAMGKLAFAPPSPLRRLGELDFFDLKTEAALLSRVEARWLSCIVEVEAALAVASRFAPTAHLDQERWAIEAVIRDFEGEAELRFSPDGAHAWVIGIDGERLESKGLGANGSIRIDVYGERTAALDALSRGRQEVRELLAGEGNRDTWDRFLEGAELDVSFSGSNDLGAGEHFAPTPAPAVAAAPPVRGAVVIPPEAPSPILDLPPSNPVAPVPLPGALSEPITGLILGPFDDPFRDYGLITPVPPQLQLVPQRSDVPRTKAVAEREKSMVSRLPRMQVDLPAALIRRGVRVHARVHDLSAGGAFVSVRLDPPPAPNEMVELETTGVPTMRCRVVHKRGRDEARLLCLSEGIGVEFVPEPSAAAATSIPHALVLMGDDEPRRQASAALSADGVLPIFAGDLMGGCSIFLHHDIALVLLDDHFHGGEWLQAAEALGLDRRRVPVLLVENRYRPIPVCPPWASRTTVEGLTKRLIQNTLLSARAR